MKTFIVGLLIIVLAAAALVVYPKLKPSIPPTSVPSGNDRIQVESPKPNDVISSPLTVKGEARGTWFFEASFPVYLYDETGYEIAVGIATAQGEWMTEDFVPFEATLTFKSLTNKGTLVFKKDNPSDMRELDEEFSIPVLFNE